MQKIHFINARLLLPEGIKTSELVISQGKISAIGLGLVSDSQTRTIDVNGCYIFPGSIDGHVHFREPGPTYKEDFGSGSRAALFGGVTTVFEMPNTWPTTTDRAALASKREIAESKSACNFGLFFGATPSNLDEANAVENVAGLKIFMGCSTGDLLVYKDEDLEKIFAGYSGRICVHAEWEPRLKERTAFYKDQGALAIDVHSKIRDVKCATEAIQRAGSLAVKYGRHLHILHLSSRAELDEIAALRALPSFKTSNAKITCEVCPHHLFFSTQDYEKHANLLKMNPPLRSPEDVEAMWKGLHSGEIDMIATDHAPHTWEEKNGDYWKVPSGIPAVELMLPLLLNAASEGKCTYENISKWLCENPALVYGLKDRGRIKEGKVADLVIVDPMWEHCVLNENQRSKCAWSPWAGKTLVGFPIMTIVNGQVCVENGKLIEDNLGREVTFL